MYGELKTKSEKEILKKRGAEFNTDGILNYEIGHDWAKYTSSITLRETL